MTSGVKIAGVLRLLLPGSSTRAAPQVVETSEQRDDTARSRAIGRESAPKRADNYKRRGGSAQESGGKTPSA
eukprot:15442262-Alexandrium_andersonii.AAC.1